MGFIPLPKSMLCNKYIYNVLSKYLLTCHAVLKLNGDYEMCYTNSDLDNQHKQVPQFLQFSEEACNIEHNLFHFTSHLSLHSLCTCKQYLHKLLTFLFTGFEKAWSLH